MNILIYQPRCSYYVGGGEVVALEQARFFQMSGHKVTILTTKTPFIDESGYFKEFKENNNAISIEYIELDKSFANIYTQDSGINWKRWDLESYYVGLKSRAMLGSLEEKHDTTIFHGVADTIAANNIKKSVLYLHGYPDTENYFQNICLYGATNMIAVSHRIKREWIKLANLNPENIAVQHNGIDTSNFYPEENVKKIFDFLYIGRLVEIKGVQYIIKAIQNLKENGINASLAIAGSGPHREDLAVLVDKYKLNDQVTFLGYVDEKNKRELYNSVKASILPSISREGVLTTLLESSSCGIPVISTKDSSMEEFIIDGENGILVTPKDVEELSSAMLRILQDENLRTKLGLAALGTVTQAWEWKNVIEDTITIIERMLKK